MRVRQALKIRKQLMRRSLSRYGWEGSKRHLPRWRTTLKAARRLRRVSSLFWWDTIKTWQYEYELEQQ